MPRFSCRHHGYAPPEADLMHAMRLVEVLERDIRAATLALASARKKLPQLTVALTPVKREEEE
tara:strand:+ start:1176 stop:1364 length:189 start_codon:yes stop_codon:yes gene_type:complete